MIHETGATVHAANKKTRGTCPITSPSMKKLTSRKSTLPFRWTESSQQGEEFVGRTMPPQTEWTAQPSSAPARSPGLQVFRNDHRNDTTGVQVQLRQLRMISIQLQQLETLSERFAPTYDSSRRYVHLRGMVDSVILAHQVRVLVSPVGEDLGRLS